MSLIVKKGQAANYKVKRHLTDVIPATFDLLMADNDVPPCHLSLDSASVDISTFYFDPFIHVLK